MPKRTWCSRSKGNRQRARSVLRVGSTDTLGTGPATTPKGAIQTYSCGPVGLRAGGFAPIPPASKQASKQERESASQQERCQKQLKQLKAADVRTRCEAGSRLVDPPALCRTTPTVSEAPSNDSARCNFQQLRGGGMRPIWCNSSTA